MRPLRRSRYISPALVPVVDDGYGVEPRANDPDVAILRQEERFKAVSNEIADFVIYGFLSQERITNTLKMQLYDAAIQRFRNRMPPEMIRTLVDATIRQEVGLREETARWRRAEAVRKAEDSKRRATVLSSGSQFKAAS